MADNDPGEYQKAIHPDDSKTITFHDSGTFDMADVSFGSYSLSSSSGSWSYCITCNQAACTCITQPPSAPVFAPQQGSVVFTTPNVTVDIEDIADIVNTLTICIVCGAEDSIVLCEVCKEAVKLARNEWLDAFRREIESLG